MLHVTDSHGRRIPEPDPWTGYDEYAGADTECEECGHAITVGSDDDCVLLGRSLCQLCHDNEALGALYHVGEYVKRPLAEQIELASAAVAAAENAERDARRRLALAVGRDAK